MTNIVDTSPETVDAEFDAAEKDIGLEQPETETSPEQAQIDKAQKQAEIAMATGMINTSLRLVLTSFTGVTVNEHVTNQAAESYAVLIIKYFPGGIFGLLDRYKEELAAATATFVLISAVSEAKAKKAKEETKKTEPDTKKTTFSPDTQKPEKGETDGQA